MLKKTSVLALTIAVLLTGCVTTPEFQLSEQQKSVIPADWISPKVKSVATTDAVDWWKAWNQPELSELVERAMAVNTSIQEAQANLRYAQAAITVSNASLLPSVDGSASAGRTHAASHGSNSFGIGVNGSWTIDAGGRLAALEAAKADLLSSEAELGDVQIAIASQVAQAYVNLRLAQRQVSVSEENEKTQKESYDLARWRYMSGLADSTDVDQAQTSLEQTRASIPTYKANVAQYRNVLAKLTGKKPEEIGVLPVKDIPTPPQVLSLKIPADTLRQRPDVRKAEADVMAAMARHTEARSALYPSLTINGSFGLSAATISTLGNSGTQTASALGSINLPIFNAGSLRAQVEQRDAQVAAANARYEAALLSGVQDVEDALNNIWAHEQRIKSLKIAQTSAKRAAVNAQHNYKAGLQDFTVVLTTQRSLLTVEETLASAESQYSNAYIDLYQALGGGWKVSEGFKK